MADNQVSPENQEIATTASPRRWGRATALVAGGLVAGGILAGTVTALRPTTRPTTTRPPRPATMWAGKVRIRMVAGMPARNR
ncbi:MAG: hypothetical protein ACR2JG_03985 [Geodermatophilaceae bacterium]